MPHVYRVLFSLVSLATFAVPAFAADPKAAVYDGIDLTQDWPWWRGPSHDGIAAAGQSPRWKWDDREGLLWNVPVIGRGHGSPTVIGDQVVVAVADSDEQQQGLQCFDRKTGALRWTTFVHHGGYDAKENKKSSLASVSPSGDGQRWYISFLHAEAIHTTCLDRQGKQLWQHKVNNYVNHQGFAAAPLLYRDLVIVVADNKGGGAIEALHRKTGDRVWRIERPKLPNYPSPVVFHVHGRDQLLLHGCDVVTSLDPATGRTLWETPGATTECVTTIVTDGERLFTSGGYPKNHISAVKLDGSKQVAWENNSRVYVPSMIVRDGQLYGVLDAGVATCWDSATGKERWKQRIEGNFSSSLVLVNEKLLATSETGRTYVFRATPEGFESISENQLGDEAYATPAVCGSRIFHRYAKLIDGQRREFLACIGDE